MKRTTLKTVKFPRCFEKSNPIFSLLFEIKNTVQCTNMSTLKVEHKKKSKRNAFHG